MMIEEVIKVFDNNTDAFATNRGFYYQYLILLKKWISNYISDSNNVLYSEVDDDIKEVGDKLIFTQVKCYSTNLSFNSPEVKKSIFNYFILYLKHHSLFKIEFCFCTNTGIKPKEKLLYAWSQDPKLNDDTIKRHSLDKIKTILQDEIKSRKNKKLEQIGSNTSKKKEIKWASDEILKQVNDSFIGEFIKVVKWDFLAIDPNSAISELFIEIRKMLTALKFKNKPVSIIESVLLSEIYKCSQLPDKKDRVLTNATIELLLNKTEDELKPYINNELINLIGVRFQEVKQKFSNLEKVQKIHTNNLSHLDKRVSEIERNNEPLALPKELTSLPIVFNEKLYGRNDFIAEIKEALENSRIISISGNGGSGKTVCAYNYMMQFYKHYDHIIWIDSSPSLIKSFVFNPVLTKALNLDILTDISLEDNFKIICNSISNIEGNNLLILDNYENDFISLRTVLAINNFKILVTTRENIPELKNHSLPKLNLLSSIEIYNNNITRIINDKKETIEEFLNFIDFNPLVIELCARTISSSIDLDLNSLLEDIKNQTLDNENLHIDVSLPNENYPVRLLSYLKKKFEPNNLTDYEKNLINFLALLPSEEILIDELAQIGGEESYAKNKIFFINTTNSLQKKGWLERKENTIKMQRIVQQIIIYDERNTGNPFITNIFLIIWLHHRIDEVAQTDPSKAFKFLKYAESILNSIKELYRERIYQSLLLLENSLLNSYNWLENSKNLHLRWISLLERARSFLPKDDINLGTMYNNLGLSYARQNEFESAELNFNNSIEVLQKKEAESINHLLIALNNLSFLYTENGKIDKAQQIIKKTAELSNKYSLSNSQNNAYHHFLTGIIYHDENDFISASSSFKKAISVHLQVDAKNRSDLSLAIYYANLIYSLYKLGKHEEVKTNLLLITSVLGKLNDFENSVLKEINSFVSSLNELY